MRYLDVCSGISACTAAWEPLGWQCAGYSEIEPFPRAVLEQRRGAVAVDWDHRFAPGSNVTPLFGDFTQIEAHHVGPIDLLVGGTPCQAFSVAGKRLGLDDPRGNLTIEFFRLAKRLRARWVVWENVPGVLSNWSGEPEDEAITEWEETSDFAAILALFHECGYRGGWRVLDAQYVRVDGFGRAVPQRRRRVILVGHLGDDARPAAVLFDPESLRGHHPPRRETGQGVAPTISARTRGGGGLGTDFDCDGGLIAGTIGASASRSRGAGTDPAGIVAVSGTVSSKWAKGTGGPSGDECQNLVAFPANMSATQYASAVDLSPALCAKNPTAVAFDRPGDEQWAVRRLTPRECERLQGFDDDFTLVEWRKKAAADGPRYKAIGNSMAVNVMRWIGQRIELVERAAGDRP